MSGFSKDFKEFKKYNDNVTKKLRNQLNGGMNRAARAAPIVVHFCAAF